MPKKPSLAWSQLLPLLERERVSTPEVNPAITVDSEHNSALGGISQEKKWKNTKT